MLNSVPMHNNGVSQRRTQDAELLKKSGAHKLVVADRDGNCLAFLLAWDSFDYDPETDTYVCIADSDGRELMTMYTAGRSRRLPVRTCTLSPLRTRPAAAGRCRLCKSRVPTRNSSRPACGCAPAGACAEDDADVVGDVQAAMVMIDRSYG